MLSWEASSPKTGDCPKSSLEESYHHTPEEALDPFCDAIYLANEAANQVKAALSGKERPFHPDEDALARLGFDLHDLPKLIEVSSFKFDESTHSL